MTTKPAALSAKTMLVMGCRDHLVNVLQAWHIDPERPILSMRVVEGLEHLDRATGYQISRQLVLQAMAAIPRDEPAPGDGPETGGEVTHRE